MDVDRFWEIVERTLAGNERDEAAHEEALRQECLALSQADLEDFRRLFSAFELRANRRDTWGAGYTLDGGLSDDAFAYFQSWLVGRGRTVYESVLADPDSVADVPGLLVGDSHSGRRSGASPEALGVDR